MGHDSALNVTSVRGGRSGARRGFALLTPDFLDELRNRVTLSALVSRTVPLKKAGNEFKACCPFHQEKTPSFWVNDQKGFYHCFGCSAHGDAIRWLTEARGLPFVEAVKQLADEVGMELPKPSPQEQDRMQRSVALQDVMEAATEHFQIKLAAAEGQEARRYLNRRQFDSASIADFRIGYAPPGRQGISKALTQFRSQQLIDAGLLISVDDKEPYDRFRDRVIVPIKDARGRIIAFGGRIVSEGEPKYLNSPDTFLFDKSRVLFNLDRAAPTSRQTERIIVVEGYFDVIALHQAGIRDAVAPMGTALTEPQLEQLWRLVDEPILCFDGDDAGRRAAERAAHRAMPSLRPGKQLQIALLPQGKDPDDLVREGGPEKFLNMLPGALPLASFLYAIERDRIQPGDRPERRAALREALETLAHTCADRFVADEFARAFRALFFEEFGWRRDQRKTIVSAAIRTSPRLEPNVSRSMTRSALYGLTRFPAVAAANLEAVSAMHTDHDDLARWRDAIVTSVMMNPSLDSDGIRAALEVNVLPETLQFDLCSDPRFGFMKHEVEPDRATKQLQTLVDFLVEGHSIDRQLAALDQAAIADAGGNDYDRIEVSRRPLRAARDQLILESSDWDGSVSGW